jgi:integrase
MKSRSLNIRVPRLGKNRFGVYYLRFSVPALDGKRKVLQFSLKTKDSISAKKYALRFNLCLIDEIDMNDDFPGIFTYVSEATAGRMQSADLEDAARRKEATKRGMAIRSLLHPEHLAAMRRDQSLQQSSVEPLGFEIDIHAGRFIADGAAAHLELMEALDELEAAGAIYEPTLVALQPARPPLSAPTAIATLLPSQQQSPFFGAGTHLLPAAVNMPLADAFNNHLKQEKLAGITAQTITEKRNVFDDMLSNFGDTIQLNSVMRPLISQVWKNAELMRKSRKNTDQVLSLSRINKRFGYLKKFFSSAIDAGIYHGQNPCGKPPATKNEASKTKISWKPFTNSELTTLFSPAYVQFATKPDWYWLPLIALFSGARLSELGNLELRDFEIRDGVKLFEIKAGKTLSSLRVVPIHSELIKLGLWDYIEYLKSKKAKRLFENRPASNPTKSLGRMFGVWVDQCKITDKAKVFHSFRSTVITKLRLSTDDVNPVAVMRIVGHSTSTVVDAHGGYIVGDDLTMYQKTVEQIAYPFIDFSQLRLAEPTFGTFFGEEGTFVQDATKMSTTSASRLKNQDARAERLERLSKSRNRKK